VVVYSLGLEVQLIAEVVEVTVGALVQSQFLRTLLLRLALSALVVTILILIGRSVGIETLISDVPWSRGPAAITVGGFILIVLAAAPAIETIQSSLSLSTQIETAITVFGPTATGLLGGFVLLVTLATGLSILPILSGLGLLPTSSAGPRLVISGLFITGTVGIARGTSPYAIFGAYAASIVVWNLTSYGVELTTELGSPAFHRDGELVYIAATLGGGLIAFILCLVGYRIVETINVTNSSVLVVITLSSVAVIMFVGLLFVPQQRIESLILRFRNNWQN
jgi:hypothetical protein